MYVQIFLTCRNNLRCPQLNRIKIEYLLYPRHWQALTRAIRYNYPLALWAGPNYGHRANTATRYLSWLLSLQIRPYHHISWHLGSFWVYLRSKPSTAMASFNVQAMFHRNGTQSFNTSQRLMMINKSRGLLGKRIQVGRRGKGRMSCFGTKRR